MAAILILSGAPASAAASAGWKPFGLQGMEVRSLAVAADLLCAGTVANGLFCLGPPGQTATWRPLGLAGAPITGLWIDPTQPGRIFAATNSAAGRLFRTIDGGVNWQRADAGLDGSAHRVEGIAGQATLYAIGGTVWRTDDDGGSWVPLFQANSGVSLRVPGTDPNTVWAGGETLIFSGYTVVSRNRGATWTSVWDSGTIGDNQTSDIAPHPATDGLVLTGHEGFVLRTFDHGAQFEEVLAAPARFHLAWDRSNGRRAWAAGVPNGGGWHSFASEDLGSRWTPLPPPVEPIYIFDLEPDAGRLGVVYAATENGVYRFYGGGAPLCLEARGGIDAVELRPGPCPPPTGSPIPGDVVVGRMDALAIASGRIDLGEVECLVESGDIGSAEIAPPEPAPGTALFILARLEGAADYGGASGGLPRRPSRGDCDP